MVELFSSFGIFGLLVVHLCPQIVIDVWFACLGFS